MSWTNLALRLVSVWVSALMLSGSGLAANLGFVEADYLLEAWETEQGLPENSATAMVQTPDGYLWFGTFNGLVRFDGVQFAVFDASNTPNLPSAGIVNLHLDVSRRLWVSTLRGLVVSESNRWTTFRSEPRWTGSYVRTFSENGGVLCATDFHGKVFRAQADRFEELPPPPGRKGAAYFGHVDSTGRPWVAQSGFFGYWDGNQWCPSELAGQVTNGLVGFTGLRDGQVVVVKSRELLRLDGARIVSRQLLSRVIPDVWRVDEDREGNLWISSHGLFRLQPSGDIRYYSSTNGLTYDSVRFTFEDHEGNLWVGTSGGGLMRFKPRRFLTYGTESGLSERNVRALVEAAPGRILIGTYAGGLHTCESGRVTPMDTNHQPSSVAVQCLLVDRERNLWVGLYGGEQAAGLNILTPTQRRVVPAAQTGGGNIRALFQDSQERIWIGGSQTVSVFSEGTYEVHKPAPGIFLGKIRYFAEDRQQDLIWAASSEGLFQFGQGQWREIKDSTGQSLQELLCLRVEADGALWIGRAGVGLLRWKHGQWFSLGEGQGLPTRNISCILDDDQGYWWLGSNRGVIRASPLYFSRVADGVLPALHCQVFNLSDGLASQECAMGLQTSACKDSQGRLWFATLKGAAVVDPKRLHLNNHRPQVRLNWLSYENRRGQRVEFNADQCAAFTAQTATGQAPLLIIPPGSSQLRARCAVLSFSAPEKVKLKYHLVRENKTFLEDEGNSRNIRSQWLPPGDYQLRVTAANNDGLWNDDGAVLAFVVQPFLWQRLQFRILAVIAFGAVVAASVAAHHRTRLKRAEELWKQQEALAEERARSAALTQYASDIITLLNAEGRIIYESPSASRILGYPPGSLLGKDPTELMHPDDQAKMREALAKIVQRSNQGIPMQFRFRHALGHWIELEALGTNLLDQASVRGILVTTRDITERKLAEEALQASLEEKTALLKEVHHRVKNNLQIVVSLLNLQAGRTKDQPALDTLMDTRNRVRSMALLHETLHRSGNLARINLADYVNDLCAHLFRSFGASVGRLQLKTRVKGVNLNLDQAVPCGLIINELVCNAIKHAFPNEATGQITIDLTADPHHRITLRVADDGVGLPPDFNIAQAQTLGLQLVRNLAQQLGGTAEFEAGPGTICRVSFEASQT